jgi:hypothetical protein
MLCVLNSVSVSICVRLSRNHVSTPKMTLESAVLRRRPPDAQLAARDSEYLLSVTSDERCARSSLAALRRLRSMRAVKTEWRTRCILLGGFVNRGVSTGNGF